MLHRVPRVGSPAPTLLRRTPTSRSPAALTRARAGGCASSARAENRTSQVSRRPSPRVHRFFDPGETSRAGLRDGVRFAPSAWPSEPSASSAFATKTFRGPIPQPTCSLSTLRDPGCPRSPRKTRFRLAALPWPGGSPTRWVAVSGFSFCLGLHGFLLIETFLAHKRASKEARDTKTEQKRPSQIESFCRLSLSLERRTHLIARPGSSLFSFLLDGPFGAILCERWFTRSQMASARVGSPRWGPGRSGAERNARSVQFCERTG